MLPPQTLASGLASGDLPVADLSAGALSIAGRVVGRSPLGGPPGRPVIAGRASLVVGLPVAAGRSATGAGLGTVIDPSVAGGTGRIAGRSAGGVGLSTAGLSAGGVGRVAGGVTTCGLAAG